VDDGVKPEPVRSSEHDVGAANVHRAHFVRLTSVHGEHGGGVQHGGAAVERALHRDGVGHIADHRLNALNAERRERQRDSFWRPREDTDPVPGSGERRDRVRANVSRSSGDEHEPLPSRWIERELTRRDGSGPPWGRGPQ
jgi:hypothetical protein